MIKTLYNEKFTFVLAFLLAYSIASPFFDLLFDKPVFLNISFSAVMLSAVFAMGQSRNSLMTALLFVLPSLFIIWLRFFVTSPQIMLAGAVFPALFNGYMVFVIICFIYEAPLVTRNIISAALVAYIFIALFWANLYLVLELIFPGSFSVSHEMILNDPSYLKYLSYVTITTLGYGDITPLSAKARSLVSLEAFIGQIYLAVLIARLVGMHAAHTSTNKGN